MKTLKPLRSQGVVAVLCALGASLLALPAVAGAEAMIGAAPNAGPGGLPDGRVYEEVSPPNKNGNFVAGGGVEALVEGNGFSLAAASGNALVFLGSGAMGEASSSLVLPYVARRVPGKGWTTSSTVPLSFGETRIVNGPNGIIPSVDMSRFAFTAPAPYSPEEPVGPMGTTNVYLSESPFVPPVWLSKPMIEDPLPLPGYNKSQGNYFLTGATPTLSTVYFTYSGTLLPADAARAQHVGDGQGGIGFPWGFYEWTNGALAEAGVLPDGTVSPYGAVPAAAAGSGNEQRGFEWNWQAADFDNQVSQDGSRAFFVSPDPTASTVTDPSNPGCASPEATCTNAPPELYVRETEPDGSKHTVLVSQSQLPGHVGEQAPDGPLSVRAPSSQPFGPLGSYVYASADGSQAFFASVDQLTSAAPADASVKEYDFDLETGTLTYLPGVTGSIMAAAQDGSDFIFVNTMGALDLWRSGPNGGQVTEIVPGVGSLYARASVDGSAFVFATSAVLAPGKFNNAGGYSQVYRYDTAGNELTCVSCPPAGVVPSGGATISYDDNRGGADDIPRSTQDTRVISADGNRVFFDSPDALTPQDTNGMRDVYEWEDGKVYLISSGTSSEDSYYLDSSESGDDVFFNTTAGLVGADADDAYDAYDARILRPGDNPPPAAVPCQGDVCQGPPSVPQLLGEPASAAFDGLGNLAPKKPAQTKPRAKTKSKKAKDCAKAKRRAKARRRTKSKGHAQAKRARACATRQGKQSNERNGGGR